MRQNVSFKHGGQKVCCPICSVEKTRLYDHIKVHKLTREQFKQKYPKALLKPFAGKTHIWIADDVEFLVKWFGHWGSNIVAKELGIRTVEVKLKADRLGLRLLPRHERLCYECRVNYTTEEPQRNGILCKKCKLWRIAEMRRERITKNPLEEHTRETFDAMKVRNKKRWGREVDFDRTYLLKLWEIQAGKCFYTGRPMTLNRGKMSDTDPFALSVDRIDSQKPYTKDNIVLASRWANFAKNNFDITQFKQLCLMVVKNFNL